MSNFCNPMDCILPGFSIHGISQARILEWVAISFSRGSSWPKDQTCLFYVGRQILYPWATNRFSNSSKFKRNENINPDKNWYLNVLSSTVDCSPKIEKDPNVQFSMYDSTECCISIQQNIIQQWKLMKCECTLQHGWVPEKNYTNSNRHRRVYMTQLI